MLIDLWGWLGDTEFNLNDLHEIELSRVWCKCTQELFLEITNPGLGKLLAAVAVFE